MKNDEYVEEIRVKGVDLVGKIKQICRASNVRRITIKNGKGEPIVSVSLTTVVVATILLPTVVAMLATLAVATTYTIAVEKKR
jgi:hypothetical protein